MLEGTGTHAHHDGSACPKHGHGYASRWVGVPEARARIRITMGPRARSTITGTHPDGSVRPKHDHGYTSRWIRMPEARPQVPIAMGMGSRSSITGTDHEGLACSSFASGYRSAAHGPAEADRAAAIVKGARALLRLLLPGVARMQWVRQRPTSVQRRLRHVRRRATGCNASTLLPGDRHRPGYPHRTLLLAGGHGLEFHQRHRLRRELPGWPLPRGAQVRDRVHLRDRHPVRSAASSSSRMLRRLPIDRGDAVVDHRRQPGHHLRADPRQRVDSRRSRRLASAVAGWALIANGTGRDSSPLPLAPRGEGRAPRTPPPERSAAEFRRRDSNPNKRDQNPLSYH